MQLQTDRNRGNHAQRSPECRDYFNERRKSDTPAEPGLHLYFALYQQALECCRQSLRSREEWNL